MEKSLNEAMNLRWHQLEEHALHAAVAINQGMQCIEGHLTVSYYSISAASSSVTSLLGRMSAT